MLKFCVFTVMAPDLTPEEGAAEFVRCGYEGVEWRVTHTAPERRTETPSFWGNNLCTFEPTEADAQRAGKIASESGLSTVGLGTYIDVGDLEAVENAMRFAQICGAPQIRVKQGHMRDGVPFHTAFAEAYSFLVQVQRLARRNSIKALIEIHHNTITPSASMAHRLVSDFNPDYIGVIHDAGNMVHEGFEHYRMGLELLGPFLVHVHVKNARFVRPESGGVWKSEWAPLDDGVVNWTALFEALRDVGYDGWIGLEDFSGHRSTKETLEYDIHFLKEQIAAVYGE